VYNNVLYDDKVETFVENGSKLQCVAPNELYGYRQFRGWVKAGLTGIALSKDKEVTVYAIEPIPKGSRIWPTRAGIGGT
jgi:hypothetical protein